MKDLLQQPGDRGYPTEYLLTRIKGRRSRLISDWRQLVFEGAVQDFLASSRYQGLVRERVPETAWRSLLREYRWVYTQMNEELRAQFRPFFLYTEVRTLFLCLRRLKDKNPAPAGELLELSLLSDRIRNLLSTSRDVTEAVERLERVLVPVSNRFAGLADTLNDSGLRGVEHKLLTALIEVIMNTRLHGIMRSFFSRLIDARNILALYKYLRLEQAVFPPALPGGSIGEARLREAAAKESVQGICTLVRESLGVKLETPDPTRVEIGLYRGISVFLRKEGREPFGVGPLLDYLWRCSLEVMNLSVLMNGKDIERELVASELVQ